MNYNDFKVTLWGTQGSTAVSSPRKKRYGANTSCVSVECGEHVIVFDMGTGFLSFSNYFLSNYSLPKTIDLYISHYHLDHIEGLPFAGVTYTPGVNIRFHARPIDGKSPRQILSGIFSPPYFPGNLFEDAPSDRFSFCEFQPGNPDIFSDGAIVVDNLIVPHPGDSLSFKVTYKGKSFCYLSDFEYDKYEGKLSDELITYLRGCDLTVFDAYFSNDNLIPGWGHSTWEQGLEIWREAGLKRMGMYHHNISSSDDDLDRLGDTLRAVSDNLFIAKDGMELFV